MPNEFVGILFESFSVIVGIILSKGPSPILGALGWVSVSADYGYDIGKRLLFTVTGSSASSPIMGLALVVENNLELRVNSL